MADPFSSFLNADLARQQAVWEGEGGRVVFEPGEAAPAALQRDRTATREVWRTGRHNGRAIYRQLGDDPARGDELIGFMDSAPLAAVVVDAVNARCRARATDQELERLILRAIADPGLFVSRCDDNVPCGETHRSPDGIEMVCNAPIDRPDGHEGRHADGRFEPYDWPNE